MGWIRVTVVLASAAVTVGLGGVRPAAAQEAVEARLRGFQEVPPIFTEGAGNFLGEIAEKSLNFELSYQDLEGSVQAAHIHFGQPRVNGGIIAFLCSNLGDAPEDTPACPPAPATVMGTIGPEDVVGPEEQGIEPGAFDKLVSAIRRGLTYANVHTDLFPAGEIRGQIGEPE